MIKMEDITSISVLNDDKETGTKHTTVSLSNGDQYCSCLTHSVWPLFLPDINYIRTNVNGHSYLVTKSGERWCTCGAYTTYNSQWPDWVEIFGND